MQQDLKGSKRKKLRLHKPAMKKKILPTGEDVLGFESESSDDSSGEESDEGIDSSEPSNEDCAIVEDSNIELSSANEPSVADESSEKETVDSRAKRKEDGNFKMAVEDEDENHVEAKTSYKPVKSVKFVSVTRDPAIIESR